MLQRQNHSKKMKQAVTRFIVPSATYPCFISYVYTYCDFVLATCRWDMFCYMFLCVNRVPSSSFFGENFPYNTNQSSSCQASAIEKCHAAKQRTS